MNSINVGIPWKPLGVRVRVVIVVLVFVLAGRWAPGAIVPLGLGGCLGLWLTAPLASRASRRATWA